MPDNRAGQRVAFRSADQKIVRQSLTIFEIEQDQRDQKLFL
jgi:hypothetical protein